MTLTSTISGNNGPISLTSDTYDNPVTVTGTIDSTLFNPGGGALQAVSVWNIVNQGTIELTGTGSGSGVQLDAGGSVTNAAGGLITGGPNNGLNGIYVSSGDATVVNAGSISAGGAIGGDDVLIGTSATGSVVNTGTIAGGNGTGVSIGGSGTVIAAAGVISDATGIEIGNTGYVGITSAATVRAESGFGVIIQGSGSVNNAGTLAGYFGGVQVNAGLVINSGSISASFSHRPGVQLFNGGVLSNMPGASVYAPVGIYAFQGAGTIVNQGGITGSADFGISLASGGSVTNVASGTIEGISAAQAITIAGGAGTVVNAGVIGSAQATDAIRFAAGYANRMVVDPGAVFVGKVDGGDAIGAATVSTLELASAAAAGTLSGIGTQITNFAAITFDAGAAWTISGSTAGLAGGEAISGFARTDAIELTGVSITKTAFANGTLSLTGGLYLRFPDTTYTFADFLTTNSGGNTDITVACFVAGTRVLTDTGEVAVEALRPGMRVVSLVHRRALPVRWVGWRAVAHASPVRVAAGAFGEGRPHRCLRLSPDHAVFIAGALIPVRALVNGASITRIACAAVSYFHIELDEHGVLLAEGLPTESYLDTGNRDAFANDAGGSPTYCASGLLR